MAKKIAKIDAEAMDALYSGEISRLAGAKTADKGDPQAFKDHEEYMSTLESVLKEDAKEDFSPNDPTLD